MAKRKYKPTFIELLFGSIIKTLACLVILVVGSFILVSGNVSMNISFNKAKTEPMSIIEKVGKGIALVKVGYTTASEVLK